ncbi:MAG TPA: hypothetical protein VK994_02120, partial [Bacteroidales bacterium]|nr:hypothetical protein [Bacteroidales bacterium]
DPGHVELGLSTECELCHTTNQGWEPASFDVHNNYYALTGAHMTAECTDCHSSGYTGTPNVCFSCHEQDYQGSQDPDHLAIGFPTNCDLCHTTNPGWSPASFTQHNDYYALTGAHTTAACIDCHANGYAGTPQECFACHEADYQGSLNPAHPGLGLSTDCDICHTTNPGWAPATFSIHNDYYALIGAHSSIANDCAACHNGNYISTPNTCIGCHQDDYNQTNDPPHLAAQFPTDCELCHTQSAWEPSTFNHDGLYFPIYSGSHNGEWDQCSDCHTNPSNYSVFSCTVCHEQGETDNDHSEVSGYVYNSIACYECHPDGQSKAYMKMRKSGILENRNN